MRITIIQIQMEYNKLFCSYFRFSVIQKLAYELQKFIFISTDNAKTEMYL